MYDEDMLRARARALVSDSAPDADCAAPLRQKVDGTGNISVQGNNNQVHFNAASRESYAAYSTAQLVAEQHALADDLFEMRARHSRASALTWGVSLTPPVLGILLMKHAPADWMMAGWVLSMGAGLVAWVWGVHREARLARACRALSGKLDAVQAHLLHRGNWHPLGSREPR